MKHRRPAPALACALAALWLASPAPARSSGSAPGAEESSAPTLAEIQGRLDGMNEQVQTLQGDVDKLRKVKFSGYVQARWETAENKSDSVQVTGSGPTITPANSERFSIRRGRMKLTYDSGPLSQAVLYFDGATSGSNVNFRLLEATVTLFDPWTLLHKHALTIGQMNVPFGWEIERSSSVRELPERSRAENVLFPGERDRGVKLVSAWTPQLETVVGIYNGLGISNSDFPTADPTRAKDLVARARWSQGRVDGAVSYYTGRWLTPLTGTDVVTDKTRLGLDAQTFWELPAVGGGSLRAEYYGGREVNPDSVKALTVTPASPASGRLLRPGASPAHFATDMQGWYVMWVQNVGERLQLAARWDTYDPDTGLDHDQYERTSLGINWFHDGYTRVTVAYDIPKTEKRVAGRWTDPHDNLWTLQVQHKY